MHWPTSSKSLIFCNKRVQGGHDLLHLGTMSAKNGDRSRYNRLRKQKLLKREQRAALIKKTEADKLLVK